MREKNATQEERSKWENSLAVGEGASGEKTQARRRRARTEDMKTARAAKRENAVPWGERASTGGETREGGRTMKPTAVPMKTKW
jgi:hypothetical protein